MVYICIPTRDEDRTIGVLLWKIRSVMQELGRDYAVLVFDDGSTDRTLPLLNTYKRFLPLTILGRKRPVGYGAALEHLLRAVVARTRYPKRDAVVVMQGDFTDHPGDLDALVKPFEGGADIVAGTPELDAAGGSGDAGAPWHVRLARKLGHAVLGRARPAGVESGDPFCGYRAYRAVVVGKALEACGDGPLLARSGWAANAELMAKLAPLARRIAEAPVRVRYDIRWRRSRVRLLPTVAEILRLRRAVRGLRGGAQALALSLLFAAAWPGGGVFAQNGAGATPKLLLDSLAAPAHAVSAVPFELGEDLRYKVKALIFNVGEGRMTVARIDTVRNAPAYAAEWHIQGGFLGYRIDSKFYSWMDTETLVSRRFLKDQHEGGRKRYREYDFFPEERRWHRIDYDTTATLPTSLPLDDVSFVYYARTLPLVVGETYTLNRYFKEEGNPVVIKVLRKDRREVGAGEFNTIVVQPSIRTRGLFSEGGHAEIHFSDDERRLIVYMKVDLPVAGTLSLHLEEIGNAAAAVGNAAAAGNSAAAVGESAPAVGAGAPGGQDGREVDARNRR